MFVVVVFHSSSQICSNFCFQVAARMLPMWRASGQWRKQERERERERGRERKRCEMEIKHWLFSPSLILNNKEVLSWQMHKAREWMGAYLRLWLMCLFLCTSGYFLVIVSVYFHSIWLGYHGGTSQANAAADEYEAGFTTQEKLTILSHSGIEFSILLPKTLWHIKFNLWNQHVCTFL